MRELYLNFELSKKWKKPLYNGHTLNIPTLQILSKTVNLFGTDDNQMQTCIFQNSLIGVRRPHGTDDKCPPKSTYWSQQFMIHTTNRCFLNNTYWIQQILWYRLQRDAEKIHLLDSADLIGQMINR